MEDVQKQINSYLPQEVFTQICLCVLNDILEELFVIRKINKWSPMEPNYKYKTTTENSFSNDFIQTTEIIDNLSVFKQNFSYIERALQLTFDDFAKNSSYAILSTTVDNKKMMRADQHKFQLHTLNKRFKFRNLQLFLEEEKQLFHREILEGMVNIGHIKDEIEDSITENDMKMNFIKLWQNSKSEMNDMIIDNRKQDITNKIKLNEIKINQEIRVHQEILNAFQEMQLDIELEIETWKLKYSTNLKELEEKKCYLEIKKQTQKTAMEKLNEMFIKRQKEIDDFKEYKMKQQELQTSLKRRSMAAIKIQAWWRGTMVIKGFGKFRRKKDKKGKKKSSEKIS